MSYFRTEREIEALLVEKERLIALPEGGQVPVRSMALTWGALDAVLSITDYSEADIVGLARLSQAEMGYDLKTALEAVIAYLHHRIC